MLAASSTVPRQSLRLNPRRSRSWIYRRLLSRHRGAETSSPTWREPQTELAAGFARMVAERIAAGDGEVFEAGAGPLRGDQVSMPVIEVQDADGQMVEVDTTKLTDRTVEIFGRDQCHGFAYAASVQMKWKPYVILDPDGVMVHAFAMTDDGEAFDAHGFHDPAVLSAAHGGEPLAIRHREFEDYAADSEAYAAYADYAAAELIVPLVIAAAE